MNGQMTREQRIAQNRAWAKPQYSDMRDYYLEFSAASLGRYQTAFYDVSMACLDLARREQAKSDIALWWVVPVHRITLAIFNMLHAALHAQADKVSISGDDAPAKTWGGMFVVAVGDSVWIQWNDSDSYELMRWAVGFIAVQMEALEKAAGKNAESIRIVGKLVRILKEPAAVLDSAGLKAPECSWPEEAEQA